MLDQFTISDIRQHKALSHAARVRILGALAEKAMTAKQLADLFGEEPAKTSYHVKQLVKVGLATLVHTRETQNGIVEKYYQAIAREFRTDPFLTQNQEGSGNLETSFVRALSRAQQDFLRAHRSERGSSRSDPAWGLVAIAGSPGQVPAFQAELAALLQRYAARDGEPRHTFHFLMFPGFREG